VAVVAVVSYGYVMSTPWQFAVTTYGALGNGQAIPDGAITSGQPTLTTIGLSAPSAPSPTNTGSGGTVLAGVYGVKITYVNAYGETVGSTAGTTTTSGSLSVITVPSPTVSGNASGWYAYVTQAGGSTYTRQQTLGSPTAIGKSLVISAPPTSSGAAPPGSNTTPSNPFVSGDVGKTIIVNGALAAQSAQVFTIEAFNGAGSVTLNANAAITVSGAFVLWGSDDTTAIQAAINAAAVYMEVTGYAQVYFPLPPANQFYMVAGALNNTGSANSQIVLPQPPVGLQQPVLHLYAQGRPPIPMWTGQVPQVWGALVSSGLWSSFSAQNSNYTAFDDTTAFVIGSTPAAAALLPQVNSLAQFANIKVIAENLTVITPQSDQALNYGGISLKGCAKGIFRSCNPQITANFSANSGPNEFPVITHLVNGWSAGLVHPGNGNNVDAYAYDCTVCGYGLGAILGEQGVQQDALILGCGYAFQLSGLDPTSDEHLIRIRASVQKCANVFFVAGASGQGAFYIDADIDMEALSNNASTFISDVNGTALATLFGSIRCYGNFNAQIFPPKYPIYVKIENKQPGSNPPGLIFGYTGFTTAGTGVAVQNPYWKDVRIQVSGGTDVTAISAGVTYGGTSNSATTAPAMTATGLTSGEIAWPSGGWLSITAGSMPTVNVVIPA
jgi:hypothetical protein